MSGSVNCSELLVNGTAPSFGGDGSSYTSTRFHVCTLQKCTNPDQNTISLETNNWNLDFLNNIYYNTGNVGIGVDTASFELDVSGSVNYTELLVNGTRPTFGGEYVLYDDTYETRRWIIEKCLRNINYILNYIIRCMGFKRFKYNILYKWKCWDWDDGSRI